MLSGKHTPHSLSFPESQPLRILRLRGGSVSGLPPAEAFDSTYGRAVGLPPLEARLSLFVHVWVLYLVTLR